MQLLKHVVNLMSYLYEIKAVLPPCVVVVIVSGRVRHHCVGFKLLSQGRKMHLCNPPRVGFNLNKGYDTVSNTSTLKGAMCKNSKVPPKI